jgi:integrase
MKGSIRERENKDGTVAYEVLMQLRDPATNKRVQRYKRFATRREAKRFLASFQVDQERGIAVEPSRFTVGELLLHWLDTYAQHNVSVKTYENYEGTIRNHLIPALGGMPVQRLTAKHLDAFYAEKRKDGCSEAVLAKCHQRITQALEYALRQDIVARNVAEVATAPHEVHKEMSTWTLEQAKRFLDVAAQSSHGPIWLLALSSGMRRGELLGLRWKDVDLGHATLHVRQTVITLKTGPHIKEPKTKSSKRPVGIPPHVVDALKQHRVWVKEMRLQAGSLWQEHDLVFPSAVGTPIDPTNLPRDYNRLIAKAGVPRIRIHDLRHTYCTLALERGADLLGVSKQLGHARPSTTTDQYGHVTKRMQDQVTATVGDALFG